MKKLSALTLMSYASLTAAQYAPQPSSAPISLTGAECPAVTQNRAPSRVTVANMLGAKISDPGVFTDTQMNDSSIWSVNGLDSKIEFQSTEGNVYATEALVGGVVAPADSTVHQAQGVSGYAVNRSMAGDAGSAAVGVYGQSRCEGDANGDRCWGANFVSAARTDGGYNTLEPSTLYGVEVDLDPGNTADGGDGVLSLLNANLINFTANAAFLAGGNTIANGNKWSFGLETADGGSVVAVGAGAACTVGTCGSQPLRLYYYTGGTESYATLYANSGGSLVTPPIAPEGGIKFQEETVNSLPACSTDNEGQGFWVTDASSPSPKSALTGGGTTGVLAICNGSAWTAH